MEASRKIYWPPPAPPEDPVLPDPILPDPPDPVPPDAPIPPLPEPDPLPPLDSLPGTLLESGIFPDPPRVASPPTFGPLGWPWGSAPILPDDSWPCFMDPLEPPVPPDPLPEPVPIVLSDLVPLFWFSAWDVLPVKSSIPPKMRAHAWLNRTSIQSSLIRKMRLKELSSKDSAKCRPFSIWTIVNLLRKYTRLLTVRGDRF